MRADRLLSMLMLLQSRGRMTARELASELEVSERTIYRDIQALSVAGVPVYAERGPGGGVLLVERYRSDLTGLTQDEIKALFMLGLPPALAELGLDQDLKAAFFKLAASLPQTLQYDDQQVRKRFHIDFSPWHAPAPHTTPATLQVLQQAIWESLELEVSHHTFIPVRYATVRSVLWPYGLVAKADQWYLIARRTDHLVVIRVDRIQKAVPTKRHFHRPSDFNLIQYWETWCQKNQIKAEYRVVLKVSPEILANLGFYFADEIWHLGEKDSKGWTTIEIAFEYHEQARSKLLGLGGAVEILEPVALCFSVRDFAYQILRRYGDTLFSPEGSCQEPI